MENVFPVTQFAFLFSNEMNVHDDLTAGTKCMGLIKLQMHGKSHLT